MAGKNVGKLAEILAGVKFGRLAETQAEKDCESRAAHTRARKNSGGKLTGTLAGKNHEGR